MTIVQYKNNDSEKMIEFLKNVITDTFAFENLTAPEYDTIIDEEVDYQKKRLLWCAEKSDTNKLFIAYDGDEIVGTGGFGEVGNTAKKGLELAHFPYDDLREICSFYTKPAYQNRGVGTKIYEVVLQELRKTPFKHYCLNSGYIKGQAFWKKLLGEPTAILKNYYEGSVDCHVWAGTV